MSALFFFLFDFLLIIIIIRSKEVDVVWINLREEPIIFINSAPYVLRDAEHPFSNLGSFEGIAPDHLEEMEQRLKEDLLRECAVYGGKILVHDETDLQQVCVMCVPCYGVWCVRLLTLCAACVVSLKVVSSWLTVAVNSETGMPAIETTNEVTNPKVDITRHRCPWRSRACWPYHYALIIGVCQGVAFAVHAVRCRGTSLCELLPRPRNARTVRHYRPTHWTSLRFGNTVTLTRRLSPRHATPCSSPEEKDYNEFTSILTEAPENAHIVFNCQQGVRTDVLLCWQHQHAGGLRSCGGANTTTQGGRSTVGMVAAVLIQMWSDLKKNGLPFVPGFLPGASTQERRRDRRGEYAAIMGLVRTLNQGMSSTANTTCTHLTTINLNHQPTGQLLKQQLDTAIDSCASLTNVRQNHFII